MVRRAAVRGARRRLDRHLVNAELLRALGQGYLLNLGRGSIVDTAALAAALSDGVIAGAGLDL